jgi:hypothetical protein
MCTPKTLIMRKYILFFLLVPIIYSCGSAIGSDATSKFQYGKNPLATLKEEYKLELANPYLNSASYYYARKHKDELLKTMEVVEEVEVQKDIVLIFYRFSIGTEIVKKTSYMKKMDGLYLPYYKYYSRISDDPFNNGKPEEAKVLLEKADNWEENDNIWWAL